MCVCYYRRIDKSAGRIINQGTSSTIYSRYMIILKQNLSVCKMPMSIPLIIYIYLLLDKTYSDIKKSTCAFVLYYTYYGLWGDFINASFSKARDKQSEINTVVNSQYIEDAKGWQFSYHNNIKKKNNNNNENSAVRFHCLTRTILLCCGVVRLEFLKKKYFFITLLKYMKTYIIISDVFACH